MGKKKNHKKLSKKKKGKKKSSFKKFKDDINFPFLILGIFSLLVGIYSINNKTMINTSALTTIDATLRSDIHFLKGKRAKYNCHLYTKEYVAKFIVPIGAAPGNINGLIRDIKRGDSIQLSIIDGEPDDYEHLTIYAISHNNHPIYTLADYNRNTSGYNYRLGIFFMIGGIALLIGAFFSFLPAFFR